MVGESLVVGLPHPLGIDFAPWHELRPIDGGYWDRIGQWPERTSL